MVRLSFIQIFEVGKSRTWWSKGDLEFFIIHTSIKEVLDLKLANLIKK